jgi:hypothetical protein
MGNMRNRYKILVVKHEGKRTLGTPRLRPEDNIKTGVTEIVCEN